MILQDLFVQKSWKSCFYLEIITNHGSGFKNYEMLLFLFTNHDISWVVGKHLLNLMIVGSKIMTIQWNKRLSPYRPRLHRTNAICAKSSTATLRHWASTRRVQIIKRRRRPWISRRIRRTEWLRLCRNLGLPRWRRQLKSKPPPPPLRRRLNK